MSRIRIVPLLTAVMCLIGLAMPAMAAEVDCGDVYCFTQEDFSGTEALSGICITELPDNWLGTVTLGSRVLRPGDILTAEQIPQMTFSACRTEEDLSACITYLPISQGHVSDGVTMNIGIRGREDQAPVAEDSAWETYKNMVLEGDLKVHDPEGQTVTYTLVRSPRRGQVAIHDDGTFTYTPKKNKIGTDSFTFTATDETGHTSREATVTISLLKPSDTPQYTDTQGRDCLFAAEWMKHTGIFVGEQVGDSVCFYPDKTVSRGEFITMLVKALEIPLEEQSALTGWTDPIPEWFQPYLAAAIRSGLTAGIPSRETFDTDQAITGAEAAVMLQNALDLTAQADEETALQEDTLPVWAQDAITVLAEYGFDLPGDTALTREQAALCLYRTHELAEDAPGMLVLRTGNSGI